MIDAYDALPLLKMADKTVTNRRLSREWARDLHPSEQDVRSEDPVFFLRRVAPTTPTIRLNEERLVGDVDALLPERSSQSPVKAGAKTAQEIIAEQRAASKARQVAILSHHTNPDQGIDLVVPDKGILRSARSSVSGQDEIRYSYISEEGETFDISQYVNDEWADVGQENEVETLQTPASKDQHDLNDSPRQADTLQGLGISQPVRSASSQSHRSSTSSMVNHDLLHTIVQNSEKGAGREYINERIDRVLSKFRTDRAASATMTPSLISAAVEGSVRGSPQTRNGQDQTRGDSSPSPALEWYSPTFRDGTMSPQLEPIPANIRQAVEDAPSRSGSRQQMYSPSFDGNQFRSGTPSGRMPMHMRPTGMSRHTRAQPSIASLLSDAEGSDRTKGSPVTNAAAAASSQPVGTSAARLTQQYGPIKRSWSKPQTPIKMDEDLGIASMMAVIQARANHARSLTRPLEDRSNMTEVEKRWIGRPTLNSLSMKKLPCSTRQRYLTTAKALNDIENETADLMKQILALNVQERQDKKLQEAHQPLVEAGEPGDTFLNDAK